jgi:hypothetical protein
MQKIKLDQVDPVFGEQCVRVTVLVTTDSYSDNEEKYAQGLEFYRALEKKQSDAES